MIIKKLVWDEWNRMHVAKHSVEPDEVEGVCTEKKILINKSGFLKVRVIGQTQVGRYLTIFLANRGGGNYYPISARDCAPKEKKLYKRRFK